MQGSRRTKGKREGRKDNAATIKLSRLTPGIKRPRRTLGSVTKLLEYFAPWSRGENGWRMETVEKVEDGKAEKPLDHSFAGPDKLPV